MNLPNLKHLQYLISLHEYQHFNKAAQACFVSQSTLSNAIVKLEEQMSCQLLERDHKAFIFTAQGEEVVKMARQLVVQATDMVDYAQQQGNPESGSVRIGCIPTVAPFLLADLVKHCQKELPQLSLYLDEDTTENLLVKLGNGDIDIALLAFPIEKNNFQSSALGKDRFYVAGKKAQIESLSPANAPEAMQLIQFEQLPEQSIFLLSEEHCLTEHAVSACRLADKSRIHPFNATSIATLIQMTAFHNGVTFLPEMAVRKDVGKREGLVAIPLEENVYREIGMLWRPTSLRRQTFKKLEAILERIIN